MSFDEWDWEALSVLILSLGWLGKLRFSSIVQRKKDYNDLLVPLINKMITAVLHSYDGIFPNNHLQVLGKEFSNRKEALRDCSKIKQYNEEFMNNYAQLHDLEQKQKLEPEDRPIELLKLKSWFNKQQPDKIYDIYSEYYRWYK